jgi:hypothetical protein
VDYQNVVTICWRKQPHYSFFFLLDDDFELGEDIHLDILLELIYTHQNIDIIAGKIPEDSI